MSCKYKIAGEQGSFRCKVTYGECLFITGNDGEDCPIYLNYKDYDLYLQLIEENLENNS